MAKLAEPHSLNAKPRTIEVSQKDLEQNPKPQTLNRGPRALNKPREAEHRALFRNWFVRFCGVRPAKVGRGGGLHAVLWLMAVGVIRFFV